MDLPAGRLPVPAGGPEPGSTAPSAGPESTAPASTPPPTGESAAPPAAEQDAGLALVVVVEALNLTLRPVADQLTRFTADLPNLAAQLDGRLQRLSDVYRGLELPVQLRSAIDDWLASITRGQLGLARAFSCRS